MAARHEFKETPFIASMATVTQPGQSEQPILSPPIRQSIFQWMKEMEAADELKLVKLEPRRRIIFNGPPGCGKTTMAQHVAGRLGLPLVLVNAQAMTKATLGGTGNNIDMLFRELQPQAAHCVLFLDEFDSMACKRMSSNDGFDREMNNIVIALLQKIDSYKGIIMAATNRADDIDPAIWRRFEMHIEIGVPDNESRFAILKRYLAPFDMDDDGFDVLVEATGGATPSLLKSFAESLKRDMVLAPRFGQSTDVNPTIIRALMSARPHAEMTEPPIWKDPESVIENLASYWPPKLPQAA